MKFLFVTIVGAIGVFLLFASFEISFNPFHLKIGFWRSAIGVFAIIAGILLIIYDIHEEAYRDGFVEGIEFLKDTANQKSK